MSFEKRLKSSFLGDTLDPFYIFEQKLSAPKSIKKKQTENMDG